MNELPIQTCGSWSAVLIVALLTAVAAADPRDDRDAPKLPGHPQVSLIDLHASAQKVGGEDGGLKGPFVVLGTVNCAQGKGDKSFILEQPLAMCCTTRISVYIHVRGEQSASVKQGQWLAVYGQLRRDDAARAAVKAPPGRGLFDGSLVVEAELIVPAERLFKRDGIMKVLDTPSLSYFSRAVRDTGLTDQLQVMEKVTVLAPVDQAFENMPKAELEALFKPQNRERLRHLVLNHVIADQLSEADLMRRDAVTTLSKRELRVETVNGLLRIGSARTVFEDVEASNGVLHMINDVILPPADLIEQLKERRNKRIEGESKGTSP